MIKKNMGSISNFAGTYLCKDSNTVPNPHNKSGPNLARKQGTCRGYDKSVCGKIYWRNCDPASGWNLKGCTDDNGNQIAYPCAWDNTRQVCDVDQRINPKTGKHLLVKNINIGPDNKAVDFLDKSCFDRVGDPLCLHSGVACASSIEKGGKVVYDENAGDAYEALRCWVGANGVPYSANAPGIPDDERTVYPAYVKCSWDGSNCIPEDCGCGDNLNKDRWLVDDGDHCGNHVSCTSGYCK